MTGPEHYREANTILVDDPGCDYGCPHTGCVHEMRLIARAQAHATLALAAVTAEVAFDLGERSAWQKVFAADAPEVTP